MNTELALPGGGLYQLDQPVVAGREPVALGDVACVLEVAIPGDWSDSKRSRHLLDGGTPPPRSESAMTGNALPHNSKSMKM